MYIYKITRYDFQNNRKDETTALYFSNIVAATNYIVKNCGKSIEYYKNWDRIQQNTKRGIISMLANLSIASEQTFWVNGNIADRYTAECFVLNSNWE